VDEVEDEDAPGASEGKKKKKKKPKKKKAAGGAGEEEDNPPAVAEEADADEDDDAPELPTGASEAVSPGAEPMSPGSAAKKAANKKKKKKPTASKGVGLGAGVYGESQSSLWSGTTATAQSAHSYLRDTGTETKEKTKSRAAHGSMFTQSADKKVVAAPVVETSKAKVMFSKLKKKTKSCMRRLMGTQDEEDKQGMRWEQFVQVGPPFCSKEPRLTLLL
jgi:hypothetical protein